MTTDAGMDPSLARPIRGVADLDGWFAQGAKPRARWGVGLEYERLGVFAENGRAIPYFGSRGVAALFQDLVSRSGWAPILEGSHPIALERGASRITLEPGGQTELSSRVHTDLDELMREVCDYVEEINAVSRPRGVKWIGLGLQPFSQREEISWVPKVRYRWMSEALSRTGSLGHDMMKRTAGIQVNFDYASEADAFVRFRALMGIAPVVTALFANSPLTAGMATGLLSTRAAIWQDTDPARCGLLPFAFEDRPLFETYRDWALDVPMMFVVRDARWIPLHIPFRRFLADGWQGLTARLADWDLHLTTLFPEVRLKRYIEARSADSGDASLAMALAALLKGIVYDDQATAEAWDLVRSFSFPERREMLREVARVGLAAQAGGTSLRETATALVSAARSGLGRQTAQTGVNEARFLDPLDIILAEGESPAGRVLRMWDGELRRDPTRLVETFSQVRLPCYCG